MEDDLVECRQVAPLCGCDECLLIVLGPPRGRRTVAWLPQVSPEETARRIGPAGCQATRLKRRNPKRCSSKYTIDPAGDGTANGFDGHPVLRYTRFLLKPKWRNGIRDGLKHHWRLLLVGSSPTFGILLAQASNVSFILFECQRGPCEGIIAAFLRTDQSLRPIHMAISRCTRLRGQHSYSPAKVAGAGT